MHLSFDLEIESAPAGDAIGAIDFPRPSTKLYGHQLDVVGWAISTNTPAAAIEAGVVGHEPARAAPGLPRRDVAAHFPDIPHAGESGFSMLIDVPESERAEVVVSLVLPNGERVKAGVIRLTARRREGWSAADAPLVSVVIPCYNQAHFLREAVESVRRQSYPRVETILVDDGSTDDTTAVAAELGVRCIRQENRGLAGARNRGLAESSGDYVVFLDADDRLLPYGLEANADAFKERPEAAFVSSWFRYIDKIGNPISLPVLPPIPPAQDHYRALLDCSYWIGCPAQAMFQRDAVLAAGGYDEAFRACEDRDLYLRVARSRVIYAHNGGPVCEYRQHRESMSQNHARMLKWSVLTLRRQRRWTWRSRSLRVAYRRGIECARDLYGDALVIDLVSLLRRRMWRDGVKVSAVLARWYPLGLVHSLRRVSAAAQ
jgi:glycosyltransferase involved in cell wall biosynthesis